MRDAIDPDALPLLAVWLTHDSAELTCLPRTGADDLIRRAREIHDATGFGVHLVLSPERGVLIDPFGECDRASFIPPRFPLTGHLRVGPPGGDREIRAREDSLAARCRAAGGAPAPDETERLRVVRALATMAARLEQRARAGHGTMVVSPGPRNDQCVMSSPGLAPCQCFSPAEMSAMSPASMF